MNNEQKYEINEGNPSRKERIEALFNGKIIKVTDKYSTLFHKLDKYDRLTFSYTGHPDSFQPYTDGYDFTRVLEDFNIEVETEKKIEILDDFI